jgi:hypothetical protein
MDMSPNAPKISDGARFLRDNTPYQLSCLICELGQRL